MNFKNITYSKNFNPGGYAVRAILLYLYEMFKANPDLGQKVYTDGQSKEESFGSILITTRNDWEEKYRNKRPCLIVSRGNIITGINGTAANAGVLSITNNGEVVNHLDLISCPIVVESITGSDMECETLSSIVSTFLTMDLRPLRSLGMQIAGNPIITSTQIYDKHNISFISSVNMNIQMERQYKSRVIGQNVLEQIKLTLNSLDIADIKKD